MQVSLIDYSIASCHHLIWLLSTVFNTLMDVDFLYRFFHCFLSSSALTTVSHFRPLSNVFSLEIFLLFFCQHMLLFIVNYFLIIAECRSLPGFPIASSIITLSVCSVILGALVNQSLPSIFLSLYLIWSQHLGRLTFLWLFLSKFCLTYLLFTIYNLCLSAIFA